MQALDPSPDSVRGLLPARPVALALWGLASGCAWLAAAAVAEHQASDLGALIAALVRYWADSFGTILGCVAGAVLSGVRLTRIPSIARLFAVPAIAAMAFGVVSMMYEYHRGLPRFLVIAASVGIGIFGLAIVLSLWAPRASNARRLLIGALTFPIVTILGHALGSGIYGSVIDALPMAGAVLRHNATKLLATMFIGLAAAPPLQFSRGPADE